MANSFESYIPESEKALQDDLVKFIRIYRERFASALAHPGDKFDLGAQPVHRNPVDQLIEDVQKRNLERTHAILSDLFSGEVVTIGVGRSAPEPASEPSKFALGARDLLKRMGDEFAEDGE